MSTEILNFCPHDVHLYAKDGTTLLRTYPKEKTSLRLVNNPSIEEEFLGLPTIPRPSYSGVEGLPDPASYANKPAPTIIVSMVVGESPAVDRMYPGNIIGPDTSPQGVVRDDKGTITGTKRFVVYKRVN